MRTLVPAAILAELILAIGAALLLANLAVVVRERRGSRPAEARKPNMKVVGANIAVGSLLTIWAVATLVVAR